MSSELQNRFNVLKRQPVSLAKATALESLALEADAGNLRKLAYDIRMEVVDVASDVAAYEKTTVAFAWCLAQYDKDPDGLDLYDLLWAYKWVLGSISQFPAVSRNKIFNMVADFKERLRNAGYSERPAWKLEFVLSGHVGRIEESKTAFQQWRKTKRDDLADCLACELSSEADGLYQFAQYEEAVEHSIRVINGTNRCHAVPQTTYSTLIDSLLKLGRFDEVLHYQKLGYAISWRHRFLLTTLASHLTALTAIGETTTGLRVMERHLQWAVETKELLRRMRFYFATELLLTRVAEKSSRSRKLKMPRSLSCYREDATYSTAELAAFFHQEVTKLARQFDQRNGNDYYITKFEADREFVLRQCVPL